MPRRPGEKRRSSSGGTGLSPTSSVGSEPGAPNLSTSPTSTAATSSHSGSGERLTCFLVRQQCCQEAGCE